MADRDDVLLDLSAWSGSAGSGSRAEGPRRTTLPPRPTRRAGPSLPVRRLLPVVAVLGLGLFVLPLPGTGCGSPVAVWADGPERVTGDASPELDDAQVAADAEAVRRAQLALAAPAVAPGPGATSTPVPVTMTVTRPGSAQAAARVPELERAVSEDEQEVADAKAARDQVVEQQQASNDPNAYDTEVAAAQEELDAAEARLAGSREALATARRAARSTTVTLATTSPSPLAAAAGRGTMVAQGPSRAEQTAALAQARRAQAAHFAQRRAALASWTDARAVEAARLDAANAALRACEQRVRIPAGLGALGLTAAAAALVRQRATGKGL